MYEVITPEGETLALKLHRLGRTSFRAVKSKRDYLRATNTHTNWLYLSRLAALKEHAFMKALGDHGFPVPVAVDVNRHAVLMSLIDGAPLTQRYKSRCADPGKVYAQCVEQLARLARCGLVHCDFNEFNIMCNDALEITVIDFPQMVSTNHPNAEALFLRDLRCLHKFFLRRFDYRPEDDEGAAPDPKFFDHARGGVGHGGGEGVEKSLDVSLRASGFTAAAGRDLDAYNGAREAKRNAEENEAPSRSDEEEEESGEEDEEAPSRSDDDESEESEDGTGGASSRFGFVERGDEELESEGGADDSGDDLDDEDEDPESAAAAEAAVARLYGGGGSGSGSRGAFASVPEDAPALDPPDGGGGGGGGSGSESDSSYDSGEGRRSKRWAREAAAAAAAAARRREARGAAAARLGGVSLDSSSSPTSPTRARAAEGSGGEGEAKPELADAIGSRNHTKDRGGKRGAKGHQFKYDGYGGQATL